MENSAHVAVTRKKRLRSCPGFAPAPQQPMKGKTRNGAVIHRKRCSAPEGLIRRPLEPCFHRRTLSGQGTFRPLNSDQRQGCPWNEPSGAWPPTPASARVVPPLKSLPKGCCPWMQLIHHPFRSYPSIDLLQGNVTGCPRDESWPLPRHEVAAAGCPLPSGKTIVRCRPQTSLFGSSYPARLATKRYEICPINPQPGTTRFSP